MDNWISLDSDKKTACKVSERGDLTIRSFPACGAILQGYASAEYIDELTGVDCCKAAVGVLKTVVDCVRSDDVIEFERV